jgi:hypothetical protein
MPTFPVSLRWFIGLVFSAVALAGSYTVSVILPPSGFNIANMAGINNSGQAAGTAYTGTTSQAFIGSPSGSTLIPVPAGLSGAGGSGINNFGQVAGYGGAGINPQVFRAFIGTTSGSTLIPLPTGWTTASGSAINDSGQVAGTGCITCPNFLPFIGTISGSTAIPSPPCCETAWAINASGQVAGWSELVDRAYIGSTVSGSTLIPLPSGWSDASGYAINDSGQVAGNGNNSQSGNSQAFIGTALSSTGIPLPAGASGAEVTYACLNDAGVVVGGSDAGGWIWSSARGTQLLNGMVPSGWNITDALSISQNGIILAQGSFNGGTVQYVELVPAAPATTPTTPAPGTGFLAGVGLLLVFAWRFRSRLLA